MKWEKKKSMYKPLLDINSNRKKKSTQIETETRKVKEKQYYSGKDNDFIYEPLKRNMMAKGEKKLYRSNYERKRQKSGSQQECLVNIWQDYVWQEKPFKTEFFIGCFSSTNNNLEGIKAATRNANINLARVATLVPVVQTSFWNQEAASKILEKGSSSTQP